MNALAEQIGVLPIITEMVAVKSCNLIMSRVRVADAPGISRWYVGKRVTNRK